ESRFQRGRDERPNHSFVLAGKGPHPYRAIQGASPAIAVVRRCAFEEDAGDRPRHADRILRLEDVPADRDACGPARDRTLDHPEGRPIRIELRPAGDEDWHRATANDLPERVARTRVDRLDDVGAEFRADPGHVLDDVDI